MTESREDFNKRYERERAEREARENDFRVRLAEIGFDGPHKIEQADALMGIFGKRDIVYAICIGPPDKSWRGCGAMVRLDDAMERDGGLPPIERGINLHSAFHQEPARG